MKQAVMKYFRQTLCILALILCFNQPASATGETNYFDCTVFLYGFDSAVENITASSSARVRTGSAYTSRYEAPAFSVA